MNRRRLYFNILLFGINFLNPVLIIPMVISKIGLEEFGHISYVTYFSSFVLTIANFNIDLVAAQRVSIVIREGEGQDKDVLSRIFSEALVLKSLLHALMLGGVLVFSWAASGQEIIRQSFWIVAIMLIAGGINGSWFLNATGRTATLLAVEAVLKVSLLSYVMFGLKSSGTYIDYMTAISIYAALSSIAIFILVRRAGFTFQIGSLNLSYLRDASHLSAATLASTAKSYLFPILLAANMVPADFTLFALVDRYWKYYMSLSTIFTQTISLDLRSARAQSPEVYFRRLKRIMFAPFAVGAIPILVWLLVRYWFGFLWDVPVQLQSTLWIPLFALFIAYVSDLFSNQVLLVFNRNHWTAVSAVFGAVICLTPLFFVGYGASLRLAFWILLLSELGSILVKAIPSIMLLNQEVSSPKSDIPVDDA